MDLPRRAKHRSSTLKMLNLPSKKNLTPTKKKLYKQISILQRKLSYERKRVQTLKSRLLTAEKTFSTFMGNSKNFRHPVVSHFLRCQLRNAKKHPKGFRFTLDEKLMALALCKRSGKGYKCLSQLFALPSRKTLTTILNKIPINPGINAMLFNHLQDTCKLLKAEHKHCILTFDEMTLEAALHWNTAHDIVEGFVDNGFE
ncbi:Transposase protein [Popillia japonica]|uniref:Transposase protein n=1 Tax=Popillia japonica TaxID=7064 RepID=A0AAW1L6I4_POPJA